MGPGSIYAYSISRDGNISTSPIISHPKDLLLDFSISFLGSDNSAIITDPSYGASIVEVDSKYGVSVREKVVVPGEAAICWSVYSHRFGMAFVFDGGKTGITMIDAGSGTIRGTIQGAAETKGNLDAQTYGHYMYVLNGAAFVSVVDYSGLAWGGMAKEVQNFDLSALGSRQGFQGMAVYPSGEGW
jgi:hypothetical protein